MPLIWKILKVVGAILFILGLLDFIALAGVHAGLGALAQKVNEKHLSALEGLVKEYNLQGREVKPGVETAYEIMTDAQNKDAAFLQRHGNLFWERNQLINDFEKDGNPFLRMGCWLFAFDKPSETLADLSFRDRSAANRFRPGLIHGSIFLLLGAGIFLVAKLLGRNQSEANERKPLTRS